MKQDIKEKWITALRSGDYEQGYGSLVNESRYCCLGVLCDIVKDECGLTKHSNGFGYCQEDDYFLEQDILPPPVALYCELESVPFILNEEMSLTSINDCGKYSFHDIADMIEKNL